MTIKVHIRYNKISLLALQRSIVLVTTDARSELISDYSLRQVRSSEVVLELSQSISTGKESFELKNHDNFTRLEE